MNFQTNNLVGVRDTLAKKAGILAAIRGYFHQQGVLEVSTSSLRHFAASDVNLQNLIVANSLHVDEQRFLQTSPEAAMKCLLAQGSGCIYEIATVFRDDPIGRWHQQEFTMLEWYRVGFSLRELYGDICGLLAALGFVVESVRHSSYRDVFALHAGLDPFLSDTGDLRRFIQETIDESFSAADFLGSAAEDSDLCRELYLDLIMSHQVQPNLGGSGFEFVYDYPASQAALAKVRRDQEGRLVASRAELFFRGVELANAYDELLDAEELEKRYDSDCRQRSARGLPVYPIDRELQDAMQLGMPACAGVALGVERLIQFL